MSPTMPIRRGAPFTGRSLRDLFRQVVKPPHGSRDILFAGGSNVQAPTARVRRRQIIPKAGNVFPCVITAITGSENATYDAHVIDNDSKEVLSATPLYRPVDIGDVNMIPPPFVEDSVFGLMIDLGSLAPTPTDNLRLFMVAGEVIKTSECP